MLAEEYFTEPFWAVPSREPYGDKDVDTIYRAVGSTLTHWEELETELGALFTILVESKSQAAFRVYGNIASAKNRYEALKTAAEIYFQRGRGVDWDLTRREELYKKYEELTKILKVMRYASPRRNDIAHGIAIIYAVEPAEGGGHFLVPPIYSTRRTTPFIDFGSADSDPLSFTPHKYAYTGAQIADYGGRFMKIHREVNNLSRHLSQLHNQSRPETP